MLRTVYYARVSTEKEMQLNALKDQIATLEEYIHNRRDWTFIRGYVDEGKTATTVHKRHDYQRLMADMRKNEFDIVVIIRVDRGWRNDRDWALFETELILSKVKLFTVTNNSFYNFRDSGNWLQAGIEAKLAELFSRQQSIKMTEAFTKGKKKGKIYGNSRIWGYDYVNGSFVVNEREKVLIQYIFSRYVEGAGFRTISKELYEKGLYDHGTKDHLFPVTTLKRIVRNPKYMGVLVTNKTRFDFFEKRQYILPESEWLKFEGRVPPIIDEATFKKANDILNSKRTLKKETDHTYGHFQGTYPLSRKIWCDKCGKPYYFNKSTKRGIRSVWLCSTYKTWGMNKAKYGCDNIKIPAVELDSIVKQAIYYMWEDKDVVKTNVLNTIKKSILVSKKKVQASMKQRESKLDELQNVKRNMRQLLYKGLISEAEYQEDVVQIDEEINDHRRVVEKIAAGEEKSVEYRLTCYRTKSNQLIVYQMI